MLCLSNAVPSGLPYLNFDVNSKVSIVSIVGLTFSITRLSVPQ